MTRLDLLRTGTAEEIAELLCNETEDGIIRANDRNVDVAICETCPAWEFCRVGKNGFEEWLKKEVK